MALISHFIRLKFNLHKMKNKKRYLVLPKKWFSIKKTKNLINKILTTIVVFPKFEEVLFNSIMAWDTEEEVITYAEVLWVKEYKKTWRKWFRDFYWWERSHVYRDDETIDFRDTEERYWRYLVPAKLQLLIIECIQELKERRSELEELRERNRLTTKEQLQHESRIFTYLLHNPKAMEEMSAIQIAKITNADEKVVQKILDWEIVPSWSKAQEKLMDINYKIIEKWKDKVLKSIDSLDAEKFQDLKALSDILDTAFKQNRLLEWKSTENTLVWVTDIYEAVIRNADAQKKEID